MRNPAIQAERDFNPDSLKLSVSQLLEALNQCRTERDTALATASKLQARLSAKQDRIDRLQGQLMTLAMWRRQTRKRKCITDSQFSLNLTER